MKRTMSSRARKILKKLMRAKPFHKKTFEIYGKRIVVLFKLVDNRVIVDYDQRRLEKRLKTAYSLLKAETSLDKKICKHMRLPVTYIRQNKREPLETLAIVG